MNNKLLLLLIPVFLLLFSSSVYAHCPLCTGAIALAAASASYYGIDTALIGIFVGAFAVSTGLWVGRKIKKEYIKFQLPLIALSSFLLTVVPLIYIDGGTVIFNFFVFGEPGTLFNNTYLIDKIIFGSVLGGIALYAGFRIHLYIKNIKDRVLFPFQGIFISLAAIAIAAGAVYAITGV